LDKTQKYDDKKLSMHYSCVLKVQNTELNYHTHLPHSSLTWNIPCTRSRIMELWSYNKSAIGFCFHV